MLCYSRIHFNHIAEAARLLACSTLLGTATGDAAEPADDDDALRIDLRSHV